MHVHVYHVLTCFWFIESFILQKLTVNAITDPIRCNKMMFQFMAFFQVSHSSQATQITAKYIILMGMITLCTNTVKPLIPKFRIFLCN